MRYVLTAFSFIAIGLAVLVFLPAGKQPELTENPRELPIELTKNNIRDVTPDTALPGPKVSGQLLGRLPDKVKPRPKVIRPRTQNFKNLVVTSSGILSKGDTVIQIRDIIPLKLEATCQTRSAETWPCGRFARTAMRQLVLRNVIECEQGKPAGSLIVTKCKVGGRDIGKWLVRQGWAKSNGDIYAEEMTMAQQSHSGMWRKKLP